MTIVQIQDFLMEICEISQIAYLEKFWGQEKLLHTKFQGNRSIMKCVMPIKTNIAGTALLTAAVRVYRSGFGFRPDQVYKEKQLSGFF